MIKYTISDREIERPPTKEKRPHFLLEHGDIELLVVLFIFVHSMNLGNVMQLLMAPRPSLQLYPISNIHHLQLFLAPFMAYYLGQINACPTFVPILSHVPKMFQNSGFINSDTSREQMT